MGRHQDGWEAGAAAGVVLLAALVVIAALAVVLTAVVAATKEVGRIYAARAVGHTTPTAQFLWIAMGGLALSWLVAGLLASVMPALAGLATYLVAWSFGIYLVAVEAADYLEQRREQAQLAGFEQLDSYLTEPFSPALPAGSSTSGHKTPVGAGVE